MSITNIEGLIDSVADTSSGYTDPTLLNAIEERVIELLAHDPELLFSYLYRLDVSEIKVKSILHTPTQDTTRQLAKLILDRQLSRIKTKKSIPQQPIEGWQW